MQQQKELLEREQKLAREEESVDSIVSQAMQTYQQRLAKQETESEEEEMEEESHSKSEGQGEEEREDSSVAEEIMTVTQSPLTTATTHTPTSLSKTLADKSSVTEQIAASLSISEVISEEFLTSQSLRSQTKGTSRILSEYAQDTFESLDRTTSFTHTTPRPSHPVSTSTPASGDFPSGRGIEKEPQEREDDEDSNSAMSEGPSGK